MSRHVAEPLWANACTQIEEKLPEKDFQTWILGLEARSFDGKTLVLEAPFGLFRDRVVQSFLPVIETCVSGAAKQTCQVTIEIGQLTAMRPRRVAQTTPLRRVGVPTSAKVRPLREKTFDSFLVGETNRLAYLGARQVADGASPEGGSLFLYGGIGIGKTHLLLAIVHVLRGRGKKALYYRSEDFTRRLIDSLKRGQLDAFHREIRTGDALLVENTTFFSGKKRTQQELVRILGLLRREKKTVVFTGDRSPAELDHLEPALLDHFLEGPVVEIGPLDQELRLNILRTKLGENKVTLDLHLLERLAAQLQGSVREIEGLVSRLTAANGHDDLPLKAGVLEAVILPYLSRHGVIGLDVIIDTVAWTHGLTREEMLSRDRSQRVAWPRHIAAYLCRKLTSASLPEIGVALGGRNHTSILRAVRSVSKHQLNDVCLAGKLQQMEMVIGSAPTARVA